MPTAKKWLHIAIHPLLFTCLFILVGFAVVAVEDEWFRRNFLDYILEAFMEALTVIGGPLLIVFFLTSLIGAAIANRAEKAGRSWVAFFWMSAVVSPIIMGIIAVTIKPLDSAQSKSPAGMPNSIGNLESKLVELQDLKDRGILSEAEFNAAKKKALDL